MLAVTGHGLVSLERAQLVTGRDLASCVEDDRDRAIKLTVYGGRAVRVGGRAGYVAAVELLREAGVAGASVLLGVDGTLHGDRRRARFFARNAGVPLMLLAVGDAEGLRSRAAALDGCCSIDPVVTIERVQVCKLDGVTLFAPPRGSRRATRRGCRCGRS